MDHSGHRKSIDVKFVEALTARDQLTSIPDNTVHGLQNLPKFSGFVDLFPAAGVDASMFLCEGDDMVALRCFWRGLYEPLSTRLWRRLCRDAAIVGDVGAHTGYFSLVAKAESPEIVVYSIEPQSSVFARLMLNIRANGWDANHCLNCAVTDEGESTMRLVSNSPDWFLSTGSSLQGKVNTNSKISEVAALPITRLIDHGVELLKIDIEGLEHRLLAAASEVNFGAVKDIMVECLEPMQSDINELLTRHNWVGRQIMDDAMTFGPETRDIGAGDPQNGFNWWLSRQPQEDRLRIIEGI